MRIRTFLQQILLVFSLLFLLDQCYYDNEEELYELYNQINVCDTSDIIYQNQVESIVQVHCATSGCHVAGGTGNGIFDTYAGVKSKVDNNSFNERVIVQKNMPPSAPLNDCQLQQISAWIKNGAPEN